MSLCDLPIEILSTEIFDRLDGPSGLSLLRSSRSFLTTIDILRTIKRPTYDQQHNFLLRWAWMNFAPSKLVSLLGELKGRVAIEIIEQIYLYLRFNGENVEADRLREEWRSLRPYRLHEFCTPFDLPTSLFRYLLMVLKRPEILNVGNTAMNRRFCYAIASFIKREYHDSFCTAVDNLKTDALVRFLAYRLSEKQMASLFAWRRPKSRKGGYQRIYTLRHYLAIFLIKKTPYRIVLELNNQYEPYQESRPSLIIRPDGILIETAYMSSSVPNSLLEMHMVKGRFSWIDETAQKLIDDSLIGYSAYNDSGHLSQLNEKLKRYDLKIECI